LFWSFRSSSRHEDFHYGSVVGVVCGDDVIHRQRHQSRH
jgi:hypothetical protein